MPKLYGAQALVDSELLSVGGPNHMPGRVKALVTSWDCPYIYLFGGYNSEDELLPWMWCGVYNRLTNTPIY
jgi:hypothetical protein